MTKKEVKHWKECLETLVKEEVLSEVNASYIIDKYDLRIAGIKGNWILDSEFPKWLMYVGENVIFGFDSRGKFQYSENLSDEFMKTTIEKYLKSDWCFASADHVIRRFNELTIKS